MDPSLLLDTIALRPYVFIFLLIYLIGCSLHLGLKRALIFCVGGYVITWMSEYSSIHTGFPYGYYYYIEQTRAKEIWVCGVPFMDSLSYVFLSYASYCMALTVTSPIQFKKYGFYLLETRKGRSSLSTRVLAAVFLVYLDIIIDPVALRGSKWFLGQIYGYPDGGSYFGVPISNFAGWFVVGFVLIYALQKIDTSLANKNSRDLAGYRYSSRYLIGPTLYLGILIFNLSVTFFIQEYTLAWAGVFILILPASLLGAIMNSKRKEVTPEGALAAHLRDFPGAVIPDAP
jgi:uncharacterized membrane protein